MKFRNAICFSYLKIILQGEEMNREMRILKRHLGEVEGLGDFKAKQLCSQINDANDFIGALQVLELKLKKIHSEISQRLSDVSLDFVQKRAMDANISQLIQNCSFMQTALFDKVFRVYIGKELFEFEIVNPLFILEKCDYEGVLAYIEDKREELATMLSRLAQALTSNIDPSTASIQNTPKALENKLFL